MEINKESTRVTIVLGVLALEIAILALPQITSNAIKVYSSIFQGTIILYFIFYLLTTLFCLRYNKTFLAAITKWLDRFRKGYFDVGVLILLFNFFMQLALTANEKIFQGSPIIATVMIIAVFLLLIIPSIIEFKNSIKAGRKK